MNYFTYNKLVYELREINSQVTNEKIVYYRVKDKFKPIEDLYDDLTTNLNIYILAEKYNSIKCDILVVYRIINCVIEHLDTCPDNYMIFETIRTIFYMIHKFWVCYLSFIIEDRLCLDEEFFLKGNIFAKKQIFHRENNIDNEVKIMKKNFTYKNSIEYISKIKTKINDFSDHLAKYVNDNRINNYITKSIEYLNEYITEHKFAFETRAAIVIQRAFRKYRYDPKYTFCERIQANNLLEIYNEFNME